jgi:cytochrome c553
LRPIFVSLLAWLALVLGLAGCSPESSPDGAEGTACQIGQSRACACNPAATQTCSSGQWSACSCTADSGISLPPATDSGVVLDGVGNPQAPSGAALPCDVRKLLRSECGSCHARDNQYPAPMKLETYADLHGAAPSDAASKVFQKVLERVQDTARPMPPPQFAERLGADQIATLQGWISRGAPAAPAGETCTLPPPAGGDIPSNDGGVTKPDKPDVDKTGAPEDCEEFHELRASAADDATKPFQVVSKQGQDGNTYQCFYFKADYAPESVGLWFKSLADNTKILHHWLLYGADIDAIHAPGSQSPCTAAEPGAYLIAGWAPGAPDYKPPSDVGLSMPYGDAARLILEVHWFNDGGSTLPDKSGVRFCTAKKGKRPHTAAITFTGSEGICIEPNSKREVVGMCDPDDGEDIHILRVWPHMHKTGRQMKITLLRANGAREVLHDGVFDFNDQRAYDLNDVVMRGGDRLETVCTYDNRTNMRIPFGEDTQEEMCFGFVTSWPAGALQNSILNPIVWVASPIQPARRCLDPIAIFGSCNGLADYPPPGG